MHLEPIASAVVSRDRMERSDRIGARPMMRTVGVFHLMWSLLLVLWTAAGGYLLVFSNAKWGIAPTPGWVIASVGGAVALANCWCAAVGIVWNRRARAATAVVVSGMVAALGPCIVRAILPWEDPVTGDGSPLAVLLSIIFMMAIAGGFGITGIAGLCWIARIRLEDERRVVIAEFEARRPTMLDRSVPRG